MAGRYSVRQLSRIIPPQISRELEKVVAVMAIIVHSIAVYGTPHAVVFGRILRPKKQRSSYTTSEPEVDKLKLREYGCFRRTLKLLGLT